MGGVVGTVAAAYAGPAVFGVIGMEGLAAVVGNAVIGSGFYKAGSDIGREMCEREHCLQGTSLVGVAWAEKKNHRKLSKNKTTK